MAFPTIEMQSPVENPCSHQFPYTVLDDGGIDTHPCELCGTSWADRNKDWPNALVTWSMPKEMRFGHPTVPNTFLPRQDIEVVADPGWFNRG